MNENKDVHKNRKMDHVKLIYENGMQSSKNWMDDVVLLPNAIPRVDPRDVDTSCTFLGKQFDAPVLVSAMTGGHPGTKPVNEALARACAAARVPLGLGSQRVALTDPSVIDTYTVARDVSKDLFLIGNIGIGQLARCEDPVETVRACVNMIGANAMAIHFNKLQELVQPEGDKQFGNIMKIVETVAKDAPVPIIVKEVGMGFSKLDCEILKTLPIAAIDVGGLGGTNFALVEARREDPGVPSPFTRNPGNVFHHCGTPTPVSVIHAVTLARHPVIGTGGMRTGLDVVKASCLGASMAGFAYPMLATVMNAIEHGEEAAACCTKELQTIIAETRVAMALVDASNVASLDRSMIHLRPSLDHYL